MLRLSPLFLLAVGCTSLEAGHYDFVAEGVTHVVVENHYPSRWPLVPRPTVGERGTAYFKVTVDGQPLIFGVAAATQAVLPGAYVAGPHTNRVVVRREVAGTLYIRVFGYTGEEAPPFGGQLREEVPVQVSSDLDPQARLPPGAEAETL